MNRYKNADVVFKASIWFVLVTVVDSAISVITQPFVNRILTEEQVGIYNIYNTWISVFRVIITLNLFCGVYDVLLVENKDDQNSVQSSLFVLSSIITAAFFVIVLLALKPVSFLLGLKPIYMIVMFISIFSEMVMQFYIVPLRINYKYIQYAIYVMGAFFVKSILTVLLAYYIKSDRVLGRILGFALPMLILAVVFIILMVREKSNKGVTKYWKQSLKFNLPLIPHYLSTIILASSDKVMLQHLSSEYYVGIYSVVYAFSSLSLIIFTAINNSYTPWAYEALREKNYPALRKRTNLIIFVSVLFCLMLMLFAPEGVYILGGKSYLKALPIVPILICGIFFSSFYFIFSNVEFINKRTKIVFPITLLGSAVNIGLNWLLIPKYGYFAAAYTTLIGYVIIAVCHYFYSRHILKDRAFDMRTLLMIILLLAAGTVASIILYNSVFWMRYLMILVFGVLFVILFKKTLKTKKAKS
ncbi:MAG: polysaccharide biosynthesis protein [Clostridia bacterium]|nr:polysaccharide biosynthesis protein [Clostridia bacterium]